MYYLSIYQLSWWRICLKYRRPGFDPWVGKIPWRREWQHTPVSLPGKSHGQRSLVGCSPWGRKESDMTEQLTHIHLSSIYLSIPISYLSSISIYCLSFISILYLLIYHLCITYLSTYHLAIYLHTYWKPCIYINAFSSKPINTKFILVFSLLICVSSFCGSEKPASHRLNVFIYSISHSASDHFTAVAASFPGTPAELRPLLPPAPRKPFPSPEKALPQPRESPPPAPRKSSSSPEKVHPQPRESPPPAPRKSSSSQAQTPSATLPHLQTVSPLYYDYFSL